MSPVFLLGFMCSGKSTLGRALAAETGLPFIDLDEAIEAEAGMSVKEIFASRGEAAFRQIEQQTLERVASLADTIVACGGGTPCRPGAMELMNERGTTVHLVPGMRRLVTRLMQGRAQRPLIAAIADEDAMERAARQMMEARQPHYSRAKVTFDSSLLEDDDEVRQTVRKFIDEVLPLCR